MPEEKRPLERHIPDGGGLPGTPAHSGSHGSGHSWRCRFGNFTELSKRGLPLGAAGQDPMMHTCLVKLKTQLPASC